MKARVKATGKIVEVTWDYDLRGATIVEFYTNTEDPTDVFEEEDLDFDIEDKNNIDYWTRLEHQAAIAAMQGALANNDLLMQLLKRAKSGSRITHVAVDFANACAHTFVEKLKEKEERK